MADGTQTQPMGVIEGIVLGQPLTVSQSHQAAARHAVCPERPDFFKDAAEIVARPAIQHFTDGATSALIIDGAQPAGRAALARWSHIPDEERAKWGRPADDRTLEQVSADIDAAFGRGAK